MEIFERVESIVRQMKNDIYEQLTSKINKDDFIISLKGNYLMLTSSNRETFKI